MTIPELERLVTERINENPLLKVIYFNIVDRDTLAGAQQWRDGRPKQGCVAVMAGNIRLIDNIELE